MKLVIKFKYVNIIWDINAECCKAVEPIAEQFNMTVPEFLEAKIRGKLPGQRDGRPSWNKVPKMPKGFAVTIGDPKWQHILEVVARYQKSTPEKEVWRDFVGYVESFLDDTIQHPATGEILCEDDAFDKFCTREEKHLLAA